MAEDRMLSDEILLGLIKKNGGSGGTTDYEALENLPEINDVELKGNKSLSDLGIASAQSVSNITNGESINNFAGVETALGNKQDALTAGDYISIANDEISVDREIPSVIAEYEIKTEPMVEGQAFISVTKTVNGEVVLTQKYGSSTAGINQGINFDENIYVDYSKTASWSWTYKLRNASVDHAANYTQSWNYGSTVDYTEEFYVTDHSGDKLVIKSEMDTALADKADTDMVAADFNAGTSYTAGNYCVQDGKLYKFKNNHSGAWSSADVDEVKITGELSALKSGLINVNNEVDTIKNGIVYGFHIDGSVSDPSNRVTYLRDAIGKTPAYMDYTNSAFNYGSWENAFFMPRPCMVERSGNVAYYLNPNDYTKKLDGSASDVTNTSFDGNAMMEWGRNGKKIWMKIEPDSGDANSCSVYIADHRVDATYHDWSFHNCNGVSVDHFYTPIYNGSAVSDGTNNVLRSLSGQYISHTQNASTEITMAGRNNAGSAEIWGTEVYADIVLINMLLTLIGKSTNTQGVFGRGLDDGGENAMKAYVTGTLNDKGLFFGYNDGSHGVKVFGMENWWACQWRRYRGHIMVDGVQKVKLTYGTEDGSTVAGYNLTGDNYISVGATPTGTSGQYCDKYEFSPNGAFPKDADNTKATASTHYCNGLWFNNSGARVPFRGGTSTSGSHDGAWSVGLNPDASNAWWNIGAALSCKPLA